MARMTRVSPPELERVLPAPQASTSVTCAPRCSRCSAVQPPKAPAPTTTTRGLEVLKSDCASRRLTKGAAATHPRNVRRERVRSEIHSRAHAERARLIHLIADAGAETALAVERQERALVGEIVHEQRRVPLPFQHADAPV